MRILYLQQLLVFPNMSGNARSWEFASNWSRQGHQITILTSSANIREDPDFPPDVNYPFLWNKEGIDIWVVDVEYHHMMGFRRRILSFIEFFVKAYRLRKKIQSPDLLLAYIAPWTVGELGKRMARYFKCPFFLEIADVWPDVPIGMGIIRNPLLIAWLRRKTLRMFQEANHIFPFSPGMAHQIQNYEIPSSRITTILNGTSWKGKAPDSQSLQDSEIRILYTGTIGIANDLGQFVEAMHLIEKWGYLNIRAIIVGEGNDKTRVVHKYRQLGHQNIEFRTSVPRPELEKLYEEASVGIVCFASFPVLEANSATKFFDYLKLGLPVVINYGGWQAGFLQEYQCGLSSQQGDVEGFASNLVEVASNRDLRQKMAKNAFKAAGEIFDRESLALKMLHKMIRIASSNPEEE